MGGVDDCTGGWSRSRVLLDRERHAERVRAVRASLPRTTTASPVEVELPDRWRTELDPVLDPFTAFERVVLLEGDPARGDALLSHLTERQWPFRTPERQHYVAPFADAWSRTRSHMRIVEDAVRDGVRSVLVIEDRTRLVEEFAGDAVSFLRSLPVEWHRAHFVACDARPLGQDLVHAMDASDMSLYAVRAPGLRAWYSQLADALAYGDRIDGTRRGIAPVFAPRARSLVVLEDGR